MTKDVAHERDIEAYLVRRVRRAGGEVRKIRWVGRNNAPDRLVLLPSIIPAVTPIWVELKSPARLERFPSTAHERAQQREHNLMRKYGLRVEVIGTFAQIDKLLA